MKTASKKAFTLIEVIISVTITAIVVLGVIQMSNHNADMVHYILKRGNAELDNSLFLTEKVVRYSGDKKNAYDMLIDEFGISDFEARDILKKIEKKITVTEEASIPVGMEDSAPLFTFYSREVLLNGEYPSRYYTFK